MEMAGTAKNDAIRRRRNNEAISIFNGHDMNTTQPPHVAIVPTAGMGHLIPLVEFATRLVSLHPNFRVTFIIPTDGSEMKPQRSVLRSLPTAISTVFLPPVSFDDLPDDVSIETRITLSLTRSLPALRESLRVLSGSTRMAALVVDLFGTDGIDAAAELGVPAYIFFPSTANMLSFVLALPELDRTVPGEFRLMPDPLKLPGCVPVLGSDLPDPIQNRNDEAYKMTLHVSKKYRSASGILVNSFTDLEPNAFDALNRGVPTSPPVYPVGPMTGSADSTQNHEISNWLNKHPSRSVLFVSFGSGGTLSLDQLIELALGLEISQQRFILVIKSPSEKSSNATYFSAQTAKDPLAFLPEGFLERTKSVGMVLPSWAPQVQILGHASTGGFMTHCGWNSILESVVHGVPLISWPLYAEQKMNAVLVSEELRVGVRVKVNDNGLVGRHDIAKYVKELMEGEEGEVFRSNMRRFQEASRKALSSGGSSTSALAEVAEIWDKTVKI